MQDGTDVDGAWHAMPDACNFAALLGPLQRRWDGERFVYGLLVEPKHANTAGIMHGGALTALMDEVLGNTVNEVAGRRHVTVHIDTTFLARIEVGAFVEAACTVVRQTRSMTFIEAKMTVGTDIVATASLIFKAVRPSPDGTLHQR